MLRVPDPLKKLLGFILLEVFDRAAHYAEAAFADLCKTHVALAVDEVEGRPGAIPECAPHLEVVIDGHGIRHAQPFHGIAHVFQLLFVAKLRRMDADQLEAIVRVGFMYIHQTGDIVAAVNSAVGPKGNPNG